jgi:uncharacterized membrane protein
MEDHVLPSLKAPLQRALQRGLNRVIRTLAEVSAFVWSLNVLVHLYDELNTLTVLLAFLLYSLLRALNSARIPVATIRLGRVGGDLYDVVEWGEGVSVVRVRFGGSTFIEVYLSLTAAVFLVLTTTLAVWTVLRLGAYYVELAVLLTISTLFYRLNSSYLRNIGVSVSTIPSVLYSTIVSAYLAYSLGKDVGLPLALATNALSILIGCDLLTLKYAALGSRSITIGGLGLYDAVVLIPSLSHLIALLVT